MISFLLRKHRPIVIISLLLCLSGLGQPVVTPSAFAQMAGPWSDPVLVLDANQLTIGDMDLVSDRTGGLHLFVSIGGHSADPSQPRPPNVVLYTQKIGQDWSEPIDIVINSDPSRFNASGSVTAAIDSSGRLHLGMSIAPLQYWYADVHGARSAWGWQKARSGLPEVIAVDARLFVDNKDIVHLLYTDTSGYAYYTRSEDGGENWNEPVRVSQTNTFDRFADGVDLMVDELGRIHAVWNETVSPQGYPPAGVYYAHSDDGGRTWTSPVELGGMYSNKPAIAVVGRNVHVVWSTSLADRGRYFSDSSDGGDTWRSSTRFIATMGAVLEIERDRLAQDGNGRVYWILSDETPLGTIDRFTSRLQSGWEPVQSLQLPFAYPSRDIGELRGAVVQVRNGNILDMVVLENLPQDRNGRLWHVSRLLDAPYVPARAFTTPRQAVDAVKASNQSAIAPSPSSEKITPNATKTLTTLQADSLSSEPWQPNSSLLPVVVGILPAALLVGAMLVMSLRRQRQSWRRSWRR
jgi:hypothetical protein